MDAVGFIGLGTIGAVAAKHIQQAGYPLMVRDLFPQAIQPLIEGGAHAGGLPAEIARNCRVVFTSLPGPREVEEVSLGPGGLFEGLHDATVYVDLSSSSPVLIRRIAAEFGPSGAQVMDTPLIVGKNGAAGITVRSKSI
jgi:3-hydroxyisobutyrate dehydrogenase